MPRPTHSLAAATLVGALACGSITPAVASSTVRHSGVPKEGSVAPALMGAGSFHTVDTASRPGLTLAHEDVLLEVTDDRGTRRGPAFDVQVSATSFERTGGQFDVSPSSIYVAPSVDEVTGESHSQQVELPQTLDQAVTVLRTNRRVAQHQHRSTFDLHLALPRGAPAGGYSGVLVISHVAAPGI